MQRAWYLPRIVKNVGAAPNWTTLLVAGGLASVWVLVLTGTPAGMPTQVASWLTFVALLITPGYFLGDLITWRLRLDWLERFALAFPLGVALMSIPGMVALLRHLTIHELAIGWALVAELVILLWMLHMLWLRTGTDRPNGRWRPDEIVLLSLLAIAFVAIVPTLSLAKIDGDAYAVGTFNADALAGLPLNAAEPIFGTDLGPGVRMVFNQSLPLFYLWSYLSYIDPITLTAEASRSMIALWALLATYTLGKAAGGGSRRFGLVTAAIQMLIYLAAPFLRDDNVSVFFFERINADKFMVPVTMLPVVFAFAIRYVRHGRREVWFAAAVATFAVSVIHPLVAAMLALALAAFGGLHFILHFRNRAARLRVLGLAGLVALVMVVPGVQLFLARDEAPLAPTYPQSFDGWSIGQTMVPALPFVRMPSLDVYGPLPDLSQLEPEQANTSANPFLIWRFAVNMNRRRLILFDQEHYVSDPSLILEPPYLLSLLLLPLLLWRLRSSAGAQFAIATTVAVMVVMFHPLLTPLVGALSIPWILWRLVWLLPYALILALALQRLLWLTVALLTRLPRGAVVGGVFQAYAPLALIVTAGLLARPAMSANLQDMHNRAASPSFFPTPARLLARLEEVTARGGPVTALADQSLSVTIPAYVANAGVVAHRAPTTSEIFPADRQDEALQRLIDQDTFFRTPYLTSASLKILQRYGVGYVVTTSGSDLDTQLRLAPQSFEWLLDDQSYSLYLVHEVPPVTASILGNDAMAQGEWIVAQQYYRVALEEDPGDPFALLGLADSYYIQGQFDSALTLLQQALDQIELPGLHYRLGQIYAEQGDAGRSIAEFTRAQNDAPFVARFHLALGDACLNAGQDTCAGQQYEAAVAVEALPDEAARLTAVAALWQRRGRTDQALPLYERAVALRNDEYNQFLLVSAYRELGQYDRAETVLRSMLARNRLSAEAEVTLASVMAARGEIDRAVAQYRHAIWLQELQALDTTGTHLALAQTLLDAGRLDEAEAEVEAALALQPSNASVYRLQGDLYLAQQQPDKATVAYQRALQLDPTQVAVYAALSNLSRQPAGRTDQTVELLRTATVVNPNEGTLLLALGDQLQRHGDIQAATAAYQSALRLLATDTLAPPLSYRAVWHTRAFAYARLAAIYEDLGQLEPAMNYYHAAVAAVPNEAWGHILLGDALRRRNAGPGAETAYQEAIQADPTAVDAYLHLADLLAARGDGDAAEELYGRALEVATSIAAPQESEADWSLGLDTLFPQLRTVQALLASDETLTSAADSQSLSSPTRGEGPSEALLQADETLITLRVRLFQAAGQTAEAIKLYQERIRQGEKEGWSPAILARSYKSLGDLYLVRQEPQRAVQAYRQAVELDGWWPAARLGLAQALAESNDRAGALVQIQAAADLAPGSVEAQLALAAAQTQTGETDRALAIYRATAEDHPGNPQANLALARALDENGDWEEAEERYRHAIAMTPGDVSAYVDLASLLTAQARYDEAEGFLRQALDVDRRAATAFIRLAEAEQRRGRSDRALAWYDQVSESFSGDRTVVLELIDSLLREGYLEKALGQAETAATRWPDDPAVLLRAAQAQRIVGTYTAAEASLREAVRIDPNEARLFAELAALYQSQGRAQEAIAAYQKAIELQPADESYRLALSRLWTAQGELDQALAVLRNGLFASTHPAPLHAALSTVLLQRGEADEALATLQEAIGRHGEERVLLEALGGYYRSRADFERAAETYNRALALFPDAAETHIALGELYLSQDRTEEALDHYRQAVALEPDDPAVFLALAQAYARAGETAEATTAYSDALALTPTLVEAYIGLASIDETEERWDDARARYERGLVMAPSSGRLLTDYAAFLIERGEQEQALTLLERAGELSPVADTFIARAGIYLELDRPEDAERDLRAAVTSEPGSVRALIALGDFYAEQDDVTAAREAYERATALLPGAAIGHLRLARLAFGEDDLEAARQHFDAARTAEPAIVSSLGPLVEALNANE